MTVRSEERGVRPVEDGWGDCSDCEINVRLPRVTSVWLLVQTCEIMTSEIITRC